MTDLPFEFRTGKTRKLTATTTENWKRKQMEKKNPPAPASKFFIDIFRGRYVILDKDGVPIADGGMMPGVEPRKATHPARVRWFDDLDMAREFRDKWDIKGATVHRVEGLNILQERFSY